MMGFITNLLYSKIAELYISLLPDWEWIGYRDVLKAVLSMEWKGDEMIDS
jgi:hypothetical protein